MAEPARQLRECPRVIAGAGKQLVTCGETVPCPYHGNPDAHIAGTDSLHVVRPAGER